MRKRKILLNKNVYIDRFKDQYLISQCCENVLIGDYDIDL